MGGLGGLCAVVEEDTCQKLLKKEEGRKDRGTVWLQKDAVFRDVLDLTMYLRIRRSRETLGYKVLACTLYEQNTDRCSDCQRGVSPS